MRRYLYRRGVLQYLRCSEFGGLPPFGVALRLLRERRLKMASDRSQFLSLAVLSQSVVEALIAYIEDDDWEKMKARLADVVGPLESAIGRSGASSAGRHALASYEQLRTLAEVWKPKERQDVIRTLRALLRNQTASSKSEARKLIEPFQRLSTQALWNFDQPNSAVPRGVLDLCRVP